jgi:hypothetical protein
MHVRSLSSSLAALGAAAALITWGGGAKGQEAKLKFPTSFAYDYGESTTPRAGGVSAMHALGGGLDALYLNPANLGLTRSYHIGAIGMFSPQTQRHMFGGGLMDSTRRFSGGASFIGGFQDAGRGGVLQRSVLDARVALAFAASKMLHIGIGGRYFTAYQSGNAGNFPLGDSRASGGLVQEDHSRKAMMQTVTMDAGVTVKPIEELAIAAFGQNITYPNNGLLPTMVGGGIGYGNEDFSVEADAVADINSYTKVSPRVMVGGEYLIVGRVPLRAGYRFDMLNGTGEKQAHAVSAGLGYVEPRFGVEASVRQTVSGPTPLATMIFVGLTYHLESIGLNIQQY